MFRKIFKYDFRSTSRITILFIPLVWLLAATAALLIRALEQDVIQNFFILEMGAVMGVLFSIVAMCCLPFAVLIFCLRRYYTHFFTDEGYLTFTLPVKRETLLLSKTLSTFLTIAIAALAEIIAFLILIALAPGGAGFLKEAAGELWKALSIPGVWSTILLVCACILASTFGELALMHFCMTQGFLLAKKHRVLAAFGLWYGISFVKRCISQITAFFFLFSVADNMDSFENALMSEILTATNGYIAITLAFEAACFFLFYFWNQHLLKNKLSLA